MGQTALKTRRRWWRALVKVGVGLLALHLLARFLIEVPVVRYVATCGPDMFERIYVRGPYNDQFLSLLEEAMQDEDFPYR